ncbi:type II secretory pathway pseudopilin PulG [Nocardia sp. GAS34]|uniref:Rv0361 family membrane protein n=1 Tax=unclassified Nocardia TaxID=2637762 RepID=UPI003D20CA7B
MSDAETTGEPTPIDQGEPVRSLVPFLAAAVLAVLVIVGIVIAALLHPAEKNLTDADRIANAVHAFVDAQRGTDAAKRAGTECPGFEQARSPLGPDAAGKDIAIDGLKDPHVDGNRATVTVSSKVDGKSATSVWNLTRPQGTWLVCDRP